MRKHLALMISAPVLAALLLGSYFALAPRQRSARATSAVQRQEPSVKSVEVKGDAKPLLQDLSSGIAGGAMTSCRAEMTPQGLHITAQASIRDIRPASQFFWGCRVYASGNLKTPVFEKLYLDQMFHLPESHKLNPTLDDTLVFPANAGKYRVEIVVFTIPPGFDMSRFRDPSAEQTYRFVGGGQSVVIP